jgi:hypothetical protein
MFVWLSGADRLWGWWPALVAGTSVAWGSLAPGVASRALPLTGEPLLAVVLAAVATAAASRIRPARWWLPAALLPIYAVAAANARATVGPAGDEPQYLMVAESLLRDADLALDRDFAEARYRVFHPEPLEPHFRVRGRGGEIYSLHAIGLPILILPAYALGGYAGASTFLALVGVGLALEMRRLVRAASGSDGAAEGVAWIASLSPPLIHYAGLIFTEIPAAFLFAAGLRHAVYGATRASLAWAALCAAALPWFNVRYGLLSAVIAATAIFRMREAPSRSWKDLAGPAALAAASAAALLAFHRTLWGFFDPRRVYGQRREFDLDVVPSGLPGLFFDQEFGLLPYAPVFALALAGLLPLWKRNRALAGAIVLATAGVVVVASAWPMWRGGFNPPARFLTPLVPAFAAALGAFLVRWRFGAAAALLCGWSLWTGLAGSADVAAIHRDRSGSAPFFRAHSGAAEWTTLLPSYVLDEDRDTRVLAWPWAALLCVALGASLARTRVEGSPAGFSVASLALVATAAAAGSISPWRSPVERDAARLLRPSVFRAATAAEWRPAAAGSAYEPHRFPEGWPFARMLRLGAGRHELRLAVEGAGGEPPHIVVLDSRSQPVGLAPLGYEAGGRLVGSAEIPRDGEWSLALRGGAPVRVSEVRLRRVE